VPKFWKSTALVTSHRVVNLEVERFSSVFKLRPRPEALGPRTEADYKLLSVQKKWMDDRGKEEQPAASPRKKSSASGAASAAPPSKKSSRKLKADAGQLPKDVLLNILKLTNIATVGKSSSVC